MILHTLISYQTLRFIWWLLIGILLVAFAVMDGFDLGSAILLPFAGRSDVERRVIINSVGPVWEGNQVWLILGGGAIFAAWPQLYAVSFSGFYLAMFVVLTGLILRPVAFKFRSKRDSLLWRSCWDWTLFFSGFTPTLIFGVAIGNVLQGVPFRFSEDMHIFYEGSFFGLLRPFPILCGVLSICMFVLHGSAWLKLKVEGSISQRAIRSGRIAALLAFVLYAAGGYLLSRHVEGYRIVGELLHSGPSNPLLKSAELAKGAWLSNYLEHRWLWIAPASGFIGLAGAFFTLPTRREVLPLLFSSLGIAGIILSVGASMFPFILPSSLDFRSSLTVWDASSSHLTLFIMLCVTTLFLPIIFLYTSWIYRVLRGKIDADAIHENRGHAY